VALVAAGCGEAPAVPTGPPAERHGERAPATVEAVERLRASLVAALQLYGLGRRDEALGHLAEGERRYERLRARVRPRDAVLDREIRAALVRARAGMTRGDPPRPVLTRVRALIGPLTDGVLETLVPRAARDDAGVRAEVLSRLAGALRRKYAEGVGASTRPRRRLHLQRAYGLLARAGVVGRGLGADLGPQRPAVLEPLRGMRDRVWPTGIERPPTPPPAPARVARAVERVRGALAERFGLR
jgi:hypothetical protein